MPVGRNVINCWKREIPFPSRLPSLPLAVTPFPDSNTISQVLHVYVYYASNSIRPYIRYVTGGPETLGNFFGRKTFKIPVRFVHNRRALPEV